MTSIWWIRRDLRLTDNAALQAALEAGPVSTVFILDPAFSDSSRRRRDFLYEGLHALDRDLRERGSYLILRKGKPIQVLGQLLWETDSEVIYAEEDFTPYAGRRDEEVARHLPLHLVHGQTVHHPNAILKANGTPYTVYTPYSKAWKAKLPSLFQLFPAPEKIDTPDNIRTEPLPRFKVSPLFPAGEQEALARLDEFLHRRIYSYGEDRNRMDLDGTSALSPYLHFGMLGLRQAVHAARQAAVQVRSEISKQSAETWLNELIWREFYIQILFHFPYVSKMPSTVPWPISNGSTTKISLKPGRQAGPASPLWMQPCASSRRSAGCTTGRA